MKRLQNKVVMITGAGGGIGSATVAAFVAEGARVVAADLVEQGVRELAARLGDAVLPVALDIADEDSFKRAIDTCVDHFGKIDVLFNNAALTDNDVLHADTNAMEIPVEVWNRTLQVNATGYLLGCKYGLRHMVENGGGNIINMASASAQAGDCTRVAYGASKAAVISMTKSIATQHGRKGIRCNAIAPGPIITDTFRRAAPELIDILSRHALVPELGRPEDIAELALFLASDASRYITGQVITIDGGLSAHHGHFADLEDYLASQ
mgnify:CR=1 FL=1